MRACVCVCVCERACACVCVLHVGMYLGLNFVKEKLFLEVVEGIVGTVTVQVQGV